MKGDKRWQFLCENKGFQDLGSTDQISTFGHSELLFRKFGKFGELIYDIIGRCFYLITP
jgi:hypothetical protein